MSFPNHLTGAERKALGRKWGLASADSSQRKRMERGIDWHTQRMRALHDAKGEVLREGVTYTATSATAWHVRRSLRGRVNQLDLIANQRVVRTCGRRKLPSRFKP